MKIELFQCDICGKEVRPEYWWQNSRPIKIGNFNADGINGCFGFDDKSGHEQTHCTTCRGRIVSAVMSEVNKIKSETP